MSANEIVVIRPGPRALVVDRGRFGYMGIGVSWCGAADSLALDVANRILGNDAAAAALEIAFGGASIRFTQRTRFALAGADCPASLNGESISTWAAYEASPGATLELGMPPRAVRTVLAVGGGIDVPTVMNSRTTDLAARIGGLNGRVLEAGDRVPIAATGVAQDARALLVEPPRWWTRDAQETEIGVIPGGELTSFSEEAQERLWRTRWRVSPQSNRMASVLEGEALDTRGAPELRSHAVVPGIVQVPPSGLPLVLLCDAQTTGGYPKIGVVAEADLWKLAQAQPGAHVRFAAMTLDEAASALRAIEAYLAAIAAGAVQA